MTGRLKDYDFFDINEDLHKPQRENVYLRENTIPSQIMIEEVIPREEVYVSEPLPMWFYRTL